MHHRHAVVKRAQAERYLLLTVIFLAGSVIVTRIYLELTGYPQIGNGELHIAHLLWGGLLLYIAALLPLILLNESALTWSAILNGIGIGLFIDEIGKFITRDNDYFYPPAAPIIYAFFLLSLLLFLLVRRRREAGERAELFRALERYQQVIDGSLDEAGVAELRGYLAAAQHSGATQTGALRNAELSTLLSDYLDRHLDAAMAGEPGFITRTGHRIKGWVQRISPRTHRRLLIGLLALDAIGLVASLLLFIWVISQPGMAANDLIATIVTDAEVRSAQDVPLLLLRIGLEVLASTLSLVALAFFIGRRESTATRVAIFGTAFTISTVILLTFYLDQFGAISGALYQFVVLFTATSYLPRTVDAAPRRGR